MDFFLFIFFNSALTIYDIQFSRRIAFNWLNQQDFVKVLFYLKNDYYKRNNTIIIVQWCCLSSFKFKNDPGKKSRKIPKQLKAKIEKTKTNKTVHKAKRILLKLGVLGKGKHSLLYMRHLPCYSFTICW